MVWNYFASWLLCLTLSIFKVINFLVWKTIYFLSFSLSQILYMKNNSFQSTIIIVAVVVVVVVESYLRESVWKGTISRWVMVDLDVTDGSCAPVCPFFSLHFIYARAQWAESNRLYHYVRAHKTQERERLVESYCIIYTFWFHPVPYSKAGAVLYRNMISHVCIFYKSDRLCPPVPSAFT